MCIDDSYNKFIMAIKSRIFKDSNPMNA